METKFDLLKHNLPITSLPTSPHASVSLYPASCGCGSVQGITFSVFIFAEYFTVHCKSCGKLQSG